MQLDIDLQMLRWSYLEEDAGKNGHENGNAENDDGRISERHVSQGVELAHQTGRAQEGSENQQETLAPRKRVFRPLDHDRQRRQQNTGESVRRQSDRMNGRN